jgi:hypothetical protein
MPIFLGVHKFPAGVDNAIDQNWEKYKESANELGINPIGALVSIEKGFAYCQTEADSIDQVKEAHDKVEIPFEEIIEVKNLD